MGNNSVFEKQKQKMDDLSDGYFENIFNNLLRESLSSRQRRNGLVDHFKRSIQVFANKGNVSEEVCCRAIVSAIVRYHQKMVAKNGRVCLLGKYHNVLYLGVKLCFDFRLTDTEVVSDLLEEIFRCENTFERILAGAIYGVTVAHFMAGWKSDFRDQKENISAVAYFLEEASKRKLLFRVKTDSGVELKKFADVPISPWNRAPLVAALQVLNAEIVLLLLRFDASFSFRFFEIYPRDEETSEKELECVRLLLRAVPSATELDTSNSRYEDMSSKGLISVPSGLKHLCRCEIRNLLRLNSMLPIGIRQLGLPDSLTDYIDLLSD